jgi:MYXO-CTERM domain-containing protein
MKITNIRLLAVALWVAVAGCGGSEEGSAPSPLSQTQAVRTGTHKVQVGADKAEVLEQQGARMLADYGSFTLLQVDDAALNRLRAADYELKDDYDRVLLNAGTIDTASAHGQSLRRWSRPAVSGRSLHLVQFTGPIKPEWYAQLQATGVRVVGYVPHNAYLVYGDPTALDTLRTLVDTNSTFQWEAPFLSDYKLDPLLGTVKTDLYAIQLVQDPEANAKTLELVRSLQRSERAVHEALGYVNIVSELDRSALSQVVTRPDVVYIQPRPEPELLDERQNMIVIGSLAGTQPLGPGYLPWLASKGFTQAQFTASGLGVDVSDSGVDNGTPTPNHFSLYVGGNVLGTSRVVYSRLEGTPGSSSTLQGCDGHGNINAHIVGGYVDQAAAPYTDSAGYLTGLGVAPFVKLGASVVFDPGFTNPNYENLLSRAYRDGMRISSNSWGTRFNSYTSDSQRYDALVRDAQPAGSAAPAAGNQEMTVVFAAGNAGPTASTVGSPATAKNVVTVGASENVRAFGGPDGCGIADSGADSALDMIAFSSRGPTADGRKKPDLVAPGTHITGGVPQADGQRDNPPANPTGLALGCYNGTVVCGGVGSIFAPPGQQWYTASSGTSHSTPAVAGAAALVYQYFLNQGLGMPSPAMVKAYLMNSARYMTGVGANDSLYSNSQGMGLMDLGMAFDDTGRLLDDQTASSLFTATGQTRTFSGVVSDSSKPFRVTLAWTDAPSTVVGTVWVNNLDLTVTLGGNTYRGNVFSGASSTLGGSPDAANNVESVFLPPGSSGPYTITVTASNIAADGVPGNGSAVDQDFALVAYNSCDSAPPPVTGVTASPSGTGRIAIDWTGNGSPAYRVFRAVTPGGPYTRIAEVTGTSYVDSTASGLVTYYYVVRAVQCSESADSNESSASTTGTCTVAPRFTGLNSAASAQLSTCTHNLSWAAATPLCGGSLTYSVYRGTTPGFIPSAATQLATGLTTTSFVDDRNLGPGRTYYYIVRAVEESNATNEDTNLARVAVLAGGTITPGVRFFDDFDGNRPPNAAAYWLPQVNRGSVGTINLVSDCRYQSPTRSYRFGTTSCSGTYATNQDVQLTLGGNGSVSGINGFAIPTSLGGSVLTFNMWYNTEAKFDGVYLVYSTGGATGPWTQVNDSPTAGQPYITQGRYDSVFAGTTQPLWSGVNTGENGALQPVSVDLAAMQGRTVWFGFRFISDITTNQEGFYLDDVRISADSVASCTTNTPAPGPAVAYRVTLPASAVAGATVNATVTALDSAEVTDNSYTGTATLSSSDPRATLPASITFTAGVASNVPVILGTSGTQTLTATASDNPSMIGSGSTTVAPGAAASMGITVQPSNSRAGSTSSPAVRVALFDSYGNRASGATNAITAAIDNNPGNSDLFGTTTVNASAGVATFSNMYLSKVGTGYTLRFTSSGLQPVISQAFNVSPGPAIKLLFLVQPSNVGQGDPIAPAPQVGFTDAWDNRTTAGTATMTMTLNTNPTGATLGGTTVVTPVNGVATFSNLTMNRQGSGYSFRVYAPDMVSAASTTFSVSQGQPYRVAFTTQPSTAAVGNAISPAVRATVYDRLNNVYTAAPVAVSVNLGNNPSGATLSGTTTVNTVSGVATFSDLSLDRQGNGYTLVTSGSGLLTDTSTAFNVQNPPDRLAFSVQPVSSASGATLAAVRVVTQDSGGGTVTSPPVSVTLSLANNPAGGTLSGTLTATTVNGIATFSNLSLDKVGTGYTLRASSTGLTAIVSSAFDITPGAPAALAFTSQPSSATAGASLGEVSVAIRDAAGNLVTSASNTITLALGANPGGGRLSGTTSAAAVNGVATFSNLSLDKVGAGYTLRASSGTLTSATSTAFNITPGAAASLAFRGAPASGTAGATLRSVQVELRDSLGNVTSGTDPVTLALKPNAAGATLGGTTTVAAVGGVATFSNLLVNRAGTGYVLEATSGTLSSADSEQFEVRPGAPARLAFRSSPSSTTAGAVLGALQVEIRDEQGNLIPDASNAVSLALSSAQGGTLGGTTTVTAVNGVATFSDLFINRAAQGYTLTASSGTLAGATTAGFEIVPGAAARLVFVVQPGATQAGSALGPAIRVALQDALGNLATGATDDITLELGNNPGAATLSGTRTVAAVNGVATFADLSLNRAAGGYTLRASSGSLQAAESSAFNISAGAPARLAFRSGLASAAAGASLGTLQVELLDALDNRVTQYVGDVSLALGNNSTGAALFGPASAPAVEGIATFSGINLRKAGTGYTLIASASGFSGATSSAFDIAPAAIASYTLSLPPSVPAGQEVTFSVAAYDTFGNLATNSSATVTVSSTDSRASLPAPRALAAGVLSDLKVTFRSAGLNTLTVSDGTVSATAQTNVTPFALPVASITRPASLETVSGSVTIAATGSVATGTTLASLSILVDGQVLATGTEATLTATWDTTRLADNSLHTLTAVAVDAAGNVGNSSPVIVQVRSGTGGTDGGVDGGSDGGDGTDGGNGGVDGGTGTDGGSGGVDGGGGNGGGSGCGCTSSGADASLLLALLALARYAAGRPSRRMRR